MFKITFLSQSEAEDTLINYMGQISSWESNSSSASWKIPSLLWNTKLHDHVHRSSPLVPVMSHMNPAHTISSCFFKIQPNVILPFTPGFSKWLLPFRLCDQNFLRIYHVSHACYMSCPSPLPWFGHPKIFGE